MSEGQISQDSQGIGNSRSIDTEIYELADGLRYLSESMAMEDGSGVCGILASLQKKAEGIAEVYEEKHGPSFIQEDREQERQKHRYEIYCIGRGTISGVLNLENREDLTRDQKVALQDKIEERFKDLGWVVDPYHENPFPVFLNKGFAVRKLVALMERQRLDEPIRRLIEAFYDWDNFEFGDDQHMPVSREASQLAKEGRDRIEEALNELEQKQEQAKEMVWRANEPAHQDIEVPAKP